MTDFKGINPDNRANFNTNKQGKNAQPEQNESAPQGASVDPWADQKLDPNHILSLLAAQGQSNISTGMENPAMDRAMNSFVSQVSPERHARISRIVEQAFTQEFGSAPDAEMLQNIVDDYLIGRPVVQQQAQA